MANDKKKKIDTSKPYKMSVIKPKKKPLTAGKCSTGKKLVGGKCVNDDAYWKERAKKTRESRRKRREPVDDVFGTREYPYGNGLSFEDVHGPDFYTKKKKKK